MLFRERAIGALLEMISSIGVRITLAWCLLAGSALLGSNARQDSGLPSKHEELSILSWNVRNYTLTNRWIDGRYLEDNPKPEKEKDAILKVLADVDPDVILLQEMGGEAYLNELSENLKTQNAKEYPHRLVVTGMDKVRKLALISTIPFDPVKIDSRKELSFNYQGSKESVKRGFLLVKFDWQDHTIFLGGFHLKSRYTNHKEDPLSASRREKEARAIRDFLRKNYRNTPLLLLGDLNDHSNSAPFRRFTAFAGKSLFSEIHLLDSREEKWTYFYSRERRYEQIDFAFADPSLLSDESLLVEGKILGSPEVLVGSDHRPILVELSPNAQD